jgi:hypothetical protein
MNMAIFNMLAWEKELEIRRQGHVPRRYDFGSAESTPRPRRENPRWILGWIRRQQPRECC